MAEIVATMSLPVDRLTATDCNAAARANFVLVSKPLTYPPEIAVKLQLLHEFEFHWGLE